MTFLLHNKLWTAVCRGLYSKTRCLKLWEQMVNEGLIAEDNSIVRLLGNGWVILVPADDDVADLSTDAKFAALRAALG
jgi:hypothetical protein